MASSEQHERPDIAACQRAIDAQRARIERQRAAGAEASTVAEEERRLKGYEEALTLLRTDVKTKEKKTVHERKAFANSTPAGAKKDVSGEMEKGFEPQLVEQAWDAWWTSMGFYKPTNNPDQPNFVMVIPPPNVTGSLHLGHALTDSVEDTLVRWHRMLGHNTLWVPGTDHAGIATQSVVERKLLQERGQSRHDLGREAFLAEVWKWKEEKGGHILSQLRRMGCSLDWDYLCFTMDEQRTRATQEAFVRFFNDKLIYRATRIVNWCCRLNTALSDIEVDYESIDEPVKLSVPGHGDKKYDFGLLWDFAYKLEDGDEEIVISTTRPETLLGDTAIAVHPNDPRYTHMHGRFAVHPFGQRRIPIICDAQLVDMSFGTGAVKITPAHDPNDFETGQRHGLPSICVFHDDGTINENGAPFTGLRRFDCREALVAEMERRGLFRGTHKNVMRIGRCQRTGDIIEPLIKPQWYVDTKVIAGRAADAVRSGALKLVPESHNATWFQFLDNARDWCISRQLWWGHRCPVYLYWQRGSAAARPAGRTTDEWVAAMSADEARALGAARLGVAPDQVEVAQDDDVLDTWFSSGLFPFSVFGWPAEGGAAAGGAAAGSSSDLARFYPINVMETGHDILFFWVARMVMMGLQLTDRLPFDQVFLHAMVRDAHGRKMSKSLGNTIDPVWVIEGIDLPTLQSKLFEGNLDPREICKAIKGQRTDFPTGIGECGTDALRFALCAYTSQGRDINLDVDRVVGYRHFVNKLWNATRFAMANLGGGFQPAAAEGLVGREAPIMRWILSRLSKAAGAANRCLEAFDFSGATTACYNFWLYELCDVYLEAMKPIMNGDDAGARLAAQETLYTCLDNGLRLLHPFMPFITEELWQRLARRPGDATPSLVVAAYPQKKPAYDDDLCEAEVATMMDIVRACRSLRSSYGLVKATTHFVVGSERTLAVAHKYSGVICTLGGVGALQAFASKAEAGDDARYCAVHVVSADCEVLLLLRGQVDTKQEITKLSKQLERVSKSLESLEKRRGDALKYSKVPADVQAKDAETLVAYRGEIESLRTSIDLFRSMD